MIRAFAGFSLMVRFHRPFHSKESFQTHRVVPFDNWKEDEIKKKRNDNTKEMRLPRIRDWSLCRQFGFSQKLNGTIFFRKANSIFPPLKRSSLRRTCPFARLSAGPKDIAAKQLSKSVSSSAVPKKRAFGVAETRRKEKPPASQITALFYTLTRL